MNLVDILGKTARADSGELVSLTIEDIYRTHAEFVWACLQRFGVRDRDLDDALQEVFVVVHKRLPTFRGESRITTWLYAISLRVAAAQRRRGHRRRELELDELEDSQAAHGASPEDDLLARQRRRILDQILDELELEKRALFVMFEIDELPCDRIASILDVPIGTVYSRLHAARKAFEKATARYRARAGGAR